MSREKVGERRHLAPSSALETHSGDCPYLEGFTDSWAVYREHMSMLQKTLESHALELANAIVDALKGASLEELVTMTGQRRTPSGRPAPMAPTKKGGRLPRRSLKDIATTLGSIRSLLSQHPQGLRAEQIRAELNLDSREMARPLTAGLRSGALKKTGQKRATTYFVVATRTKK